MDKFLIFVLLGIFFLMTVYSSFALLHVSATIYCSHKKGADYEIWTDTDTQSYKICTYPERFSSGDRAQLGCATLKEDLPNDLKKALDDELLHE